jgi:hypothetical protein
MTETRVPRRKKGRLPYGWIAERGFIELHLLEHADMSLFLDDDEIHAFLEGDDSTFTEVALENGWIRVSPEGFEGTQSALQHHSEDIIDLIVRYLGIDDIIIIDVYRRGDVLLGVREIFDDGLIGAINRELRAPGGRYYPPYTHQPVRVRSHKRRERK